MLLHETGLGHILNDQNLAKFNMATTYSPKTTVNWEDKEALSQYKVWMKQVERIMGGPLAQSTDAVKLNHIFIWVGGEAEMLVEDKQAEDPNLKIETLQQLLDCLQGCLKPSTYFREARDTFYNLRQMEYKTATKFYNRIISTYNMAEFPDGSEFMIVESLILGCNAPSKSKLMEEGKDAAVKECLEVMRENEAVTTFLQKLGEEEKVAVA